MEQLSKILYENILTILIFIPIIFSLPLLFLKKQSEKFIKIYSLLLSLIVFIFSLFLFLKFNPDVEGYQFIVKYKWISFLNADYHIGIDGISLLLIMLTTFTIPLSILISWQSVNKRIKLYYFMILILEGSLIGVFSSLDLLLFYVFWEFILIPMYFMIGIWGSEERVYAAVKFFLYTMIGSVLLIIGVIWLVYSCMEKDMFLNAENALRKFTLDITQLDKISPFLQPQRQILLFLLFTIGFLIKIPLFPFHTWLPDAHVQAPTAGSVILAALLLKMGTYGLLRFSVPLFPVAFLTLTPYLAVLAVVGIIYGALVSIVQKDMKKLVAFSSVSHMGFIVLGITALTQEAVQGSVIQMVNHGLSTGALFMLVGMLYERRHTKEIAQFGGIAKVMPVYAGIFLVVSLSSIGLPGLNGFIGEFLILLGAFGSQNLKSIYYSVFSATGVILSAVYLLWMYQRVFTGPVDKDENKNLKDIGKIELACLIPVLIFIVWIGVRPNTFLHKSEKSVNKIILQFKNAEIINKTRNTIDINNSVFREEK
ncbi:MAG: NADH-quinone oxidoreductase subunit M [Ignavibacteria bacterium]|nr:NADH-quinone oxidoreductase subunit M [Ignavibacteria bacterium]